MFCQTIHCAEEGSIEAYLLLCCLQAAIPLPRLESVLGAQDAAWLHRLAQGKDGEDVKPRMLPKSISCGKTFRGQNVLTGLTAVHKWLLQLGQELQERIEADRQQHQRLPKLLTVSFDSAPLEDGSEAAAAPAAGADGVSSKGGGSTSASGPSHGRLTVQNWRAGATNISRSCTLRHARADAIAADALGLVKKWARDRCALQGRGRFSSY
jgi:DNA polymerase eta